MAIAPIRTERDHQRALKEIKSLMAAKCNTPEGDRFEVLSAQVEAWEAKHCPLDSPASAG